MKRRYDFVPEPPFFRGDSKPQPYCDFLMPSGDACDERPAYAIWWTSVPAMDLDSTPVSAACSEHALAVNRNLVDRIATHPLARAAGARSET